MSRDENAQGTYIGTDWRVSLYRNVTVSLEFAEYDLRPESMNAERARKLVKEALRECQRLLATQDGDA